MASLAHRVTYVNIAGYKFVPLRELKALRQRLLAVCQAGELRGTILLSPEGINLFLAAERPAIDALLTAVRSLPGLADFAVKESFSDEQPFHRMLVRLKKEIIAFGVDGINPSQYTSPRVAPRELKRWLDDGRPLVLLDTRNAYEVKLGTFHKAVSLDIDHFRNFPAAVGELPVELKQQTVVTFCTGGIRCEKAAPYLERAGFGQVYQLDGGILKYFEECGGDHFDGECFVFDRRVGLDAALAETENTQCYKCLAPLTAADQRDPRYVYEQSCPYCYQSDDRRMRLSIAEREAAIARATTPLPGSIARDNDRPLKIAAIHDGLTLLATLERLFPQIESEYWRERIDSGLLLDATGVHAAADRRVVPGERYYHRTLGVIEPEINAAIRILHEDAAIVVVDKPAPLPIHPAGRFNHNTLQAILNTVYHPQKLRPVHRLDANTTGVVVFARTRHYASQLQPQFAAGTVAKHYLARIQGHPPHDEFRCDAPIGADATALGGRAIDDEGLAAQTEFRVLQRYDDGTTLVAARPLTGRTNQIRLHLAALGWPIVGEQTYLAEGERGATQTHPLGAPPLCLHAERIAFVHPLTQTEIAFVSPPPDWAADRP